MNKFTKEEKEEITRLAIKTEDMYFKYIRDCEEIENILKDKNPQEKDFVREVFYSIDDSRLCVSYNLHDNDYLGKAIPLSKYIDGVR